jgi:hypothetical protein
MNGLRADGTDADPAEHSQFARLIAMAVYDGPIDGLVLTRDGEQCFHFTLLAWDADQESRVFSLAPVEGQDAIAFITTLSRHSAPRWPEWWLQRLSDARADQIISDEWATLLERAGGVEQLVVCRALLAPPAMRVRLSSRDDREQFARLSRRTPDSAEVTETSYADWLRFGRSLIAVSDQ